MNDKKTELLNRIFTKYAHHQGASIFRVGGDNSKDELVKRAKNISKGFEDEVARLASDNALLISENIKLKAVNHKLRNELMKKDL